MYMYQTICKCSRVLCYCPAVRHNHFAPLLLVFFESTLVLFIGTAQKTEMNELANYTHTWNESIYININSFVSFHNFHLRLFAV